MPPFRAAIQSRAGDPARTRRASIHASPEDRPRVTQHPVSHRPALRRVCRDRPSHPYGRRRAETLLATLETRAATSYVQSSRLGPAHAALGDVDAGMFHRERAVDEHNSSTMMARAFSMFAPFRRHTRIRTLLRTAGWRDRDTAEFRVPTA